jgi:hypothetical protein
LLLAVRQASPVSPRNAALGLILFDRLVGIVAAGGGLVLKNRVLGTHFGSLEDWFRFDLFELGLEVFGALGLRGGIGPTARVGHDVLRDILYLVTGKAPASGG